MSQYNKATSFSDAVAKANARGRVYHQETLSTNNRHEGKIAYCEDQFTPFVESIGSKRTIDKNWLTNGYYDNVPFLNALNYRSAGLHKACCNLKANLITGDGYVINILDSECKRNEDGIFEEIGSKLTDKEKEDLLKRAYLIGKSWNLKEQYIPNAAKQLIIHGGYYALRDFAPLIKNSKTLGLDRASTFIRSKRVEDYQSMRLGERREFNPQTGLQESLRYFISEDFPNHGPRSVGTYDEFNNGSKKVGYIEAIAGNELKQRFTGTKANSIFCIDKTYRPKYATAAYEAIDFYDYVDSLPKLAETDNRAVSNQFALDYIVVFYRPEDTDANSETKLRLEDRDMFERSHIGAGGSNRAYMWAEPTKLADGNEKHQPHFEIITIPKNTSEERWLKTREIAQQEVLSAHKITDPTFVGKPSNSNTGFSNSSEFIITQMETLNASISTERRKLEKDIEFSFSMMGIPAEVKIIHSKSSAKRMSDELMKLYLSPDQILKHYGMDELTEEQEAKRNEYLAMTLNKKQEENV